jgi:hypothetical protein
LKSKHEARQGVDHHEETERLRDGAERERNKEHDDCEHNQATTIATKVATRSANVKKTQITFSANQNEA